MTSELAASPEELWSELDEPWREAFRQAWEAFRTGNVPVGACAATPDGTIVHAARNRVFDGDGPTGEVFGSALAHAEVNVMARLRYPQTDRLVLTTTLEPCLQCSAVIRLGLVGTVRYAGADPLWDGCHEFSPLPPREASRPARVTTSGPRDDEIGMFATLISRLGPETSGGSAADWLRASGQGAILDLAQHLRESRETQQLAAMEVDEAVEYLWPRLQSLRDAQVLTLSPEGQLGCAAAPRGTGNRSQGLLVASVGHSQKVWVLGGGGRFLVRHADSQPSGSR